MPTTWLMGVGAPVGGGAIAGWTLPQVPDQWEYLANGVALALMFVMGVAATWMWHSDPAWVKCRECSWRAMAPAYQAEARRRLHDELAHRKAA